MGKCNNFQWGSNFIPTPEEHLCLLTPQSPAVKSPGQIRERKWGAHHSAPLLWLPVIMGITLELLASRWKISIFWKYKQTCISLWTNRNACGQGRLYFKNPIHFLMSNDLMSIQNDYYSFWLWIAAQCFVVTCSIAWRNSSHTIHFQIQYDTHRQASTVTEQSASKKNSY